MTTTALLATLRTAGHLVTLLGDCGHPARTVEARASGSIWVHLDEGHSALTVARILNLPVGQVEHFDDDERRPGFTTVSTRFRGQSVMVFGAHEPAATTPESVEAVAR